MSTQYTPAPPINGIYLAKITSVRKDNHAVYIYYDIAVGDSVGWAHTQWLETGRWPLIQRIDKRAGNAVLFRMLRLLGIHNMAEAIGSLICIDLTVGNHINIRRTYPANHYTITPLDIRLGVDSWAAGTADATRAVYLASLSGLPVLYADVHERLSPMVDWCASHGVVILPSIFPAGDYTTADSDIIVDRKKDIAELIHDFASREGAMSYHLAADRAAAMDKQLVYLIGASDEDNIRCPHDLRGKTFRLPRIGDVSGDSLARRLHYYTLIHQNTDFRFCRQSQICEKIYEIVNGRRAPPCLQPA